jgi:hypothetical protein
MTAKEEDILTSQNPAMVNRYILLGNQKQEQLWLLAALLLEKVLL